jgi:prepilin-type N-terminal cleavage/methylation domain-containing protein
MKTKTSRDAGFTLLEIMIVVTIVGLLVAIAIPNFVRARSVSLQTTCINNLSQIQSAVAQWVMETKAAGNSAVRYSDIQSYLRGGVVCPVGGTSFSDSYSITDVQTPPACKQVPTGKDAHRLPEGLTP